MSSTPETEHVALFPKDYTINIDQVQAL